jgi:divalent metal cation (Fe/Co/Zn/Cd) transporter
VRRSPTALAIGVAGLLLLVAAALTGSPSALGAAVLLACLLMAVAADPPTGGRTPRQRTVARLAAAAAAVALGAIVVIGALAEGFATAASWPWVAAAGGLAAGVLLVPLVWLGRRPGTDPATASDRTTLARGAGVGAALAAGALLSAYVLPAADAAVAIAFGLIAALEGVALGRPGGAGVRRLARPQEADAIEAVVAQGPGEVLGHRRVVVRTTGGAEYLSFEVLVRPPVPVQRREAIRATLEDGCRTALPHLVPTVSLRVEAPADDA